MPAYNEASAIADVIDDIRTHSAVDIVVVDDGSTDDTVAIARSKGVIVMPLPLRLGAWGAMQAGIRYAHRQHYTTVVTMDADGQHLGNELPRLLDGIKEGASIVIGAYPDRGSPARHLAWRMFRRLTGFALQDLTSGFRAYDRRAITVLAGREASLIEYQDVGILLLLRKAGLHITEVPVKMQPRLAGASHIFNSWFVVAAYMIETTLLCFARWRVHKVA